MKPASSHLSQQLIQLTFNVLIPFKNKVFGIEQSEITIFSYNYTTCILHRSLKNNSNNYTKKKVRVVGGVKDGQ